MNALKQLPFLLLLFLSGTTLLQAQMFTVKEPERATLNTSIRSSASFGVSQFDFNYLGSLALNPTQDLSFNDYVYTARLQFQETEISYSTARNIGESGTFNYNRLFLKGGTLLPLLRTSSFRANLPISVFGHYERITNRDVLTVDANYDQLGILIGSGLTVQLIPTRFFDIVLRTDAYFGFTSRNFSQGNGTEQGIRIRGTFSTMPLFYEYGITLGYEAEFKRVNTDFQLSRYGSSGQMLFMGISF